MAAKLILSSVAATALLSSAAFAQVQTTETDPRFQPRVYGSTAVVGVDYGQGATTTQVTTIPAPTQPVVTYSQTSNVVRVVEPVTQDVQSVISAPVTYTETGVVKAQHFKQGDLSAAEYQALLEEADRIRAYQVTNENYTGVSYAATQGAVQTAPIDTSYEIELFDTSVHTPAQAVTYNENVVYAETTEVLPAGTPLATKTHTVVKGDTLYNISKRHNVSIGALRLINNLKDNNIGLGQTLRLSSEATVITENSQLTPLTMASTSSPIPYRSEVTLVRNVEPVPGQASGVYAVLPKDTLYSISRRACVKVADLISTNGIENPNALQPGQRLTMPAGHCLN